MTARFGNFAGKPALGLKGTQPKPQKRDTGKRPDYLRAVRELPCCICAAWGMPQLSPTTAHHPICGRYSQRKVPDVMSIPLCDGHHQGNFDRSKIAIHSHRALWVATYGPDTDWIAGTQDQLARLLS